LLLLLDLYEKFASVSKIKAALETHVVMIRMLLFCYIKTYFFVICNCFCHSCFCRYNICTEFLAVVQMLNFNAVSNEHENSTTMIKLVADYHE